MYLSLQPQNQTGALVQLVRIRACHARGHEFESRTHRKKNWSNSDQLFLFYIRELS